MAMDTDAAGLLVAAATRLADLVREVPDASAQAKPTTWTIAETVAHVLAELNDHADLAEGVDPPALEAGPAWRMGRQANAEQLLRSPERDLQRLAPELVPAAERAATLLGDVKGTVWSTNGLQWTGEQTLQVLLGEQLVHGLDIARAAGLPWVLPAAEALEVAKGSLSLLPDYLKPAGDPHRRLSYEIRLRGGPSYRIDIVGDTATIGPAQGRADCVLSADPVGFLRVGYGRLNPVAAALTGKVVASGRKPWLALRFGSLLAAP